MPFSKEHALQAEYFFRSLCHAVDPWAGKPFNLLPYQADIIHRVYGTLTPNGIRQYQFIFIFIPKKNGKSELAGGFVGKNLLADGLYGANVFSAANDLEQAGIVFRAFEGMVQLTPELRSRCKVIRSKHRIEVPETSSYYQVLSRVVDSKHGHNLSSVVIDEIHALRNRDLYKNLTFGTGIARKEPLKIIITTAGDDMDSVCYELYERAKAILNGDIHDPTFLPIVYEAPEDADIEDPRVWAAANPAMGYIFTEDDVREEFHSIKGNPRAENDFRQLRLNQWVGSTSAWIPRHEWDACTRVDPDEPKKVKRYIRRMEKELEGRPCYAGLDLGYSRDLTAFELLFPIDGKRIVKAIHRLYMPEDSIELIESKAKDRLAAWLKEGWIKGTPGNYTDFQAIERAILKLSERYQIKEIAYDARFAGQLAQRLETKHKMKMVAISQGPAGMSAASKEFETLVLAHELDHGGHPVVRWMVEGCEIKEDSSGAIRPVKPKRGSSKKIDAVAALVMALDRVIRHEGPRQWAYSDPEAIVAV